MGHCVVAHLRPQRNLDGLDGFCLLSFFLFFSFFCFYCFYLINFKIVFLSLYFDNLIMLKFRDIWEKDCCVCSCERRERIIFLLRCMNFLSRKIHLELLQCSLYQEAVATSKKIWKSFAYRESVGASFLGLLSKT